MKTSILCCGLVCCTLFSLLLTACSNGAVTKSQATAVVPSPTSAPDQGVGAPKCQQASTITKSAIGLPETQGTGRGMEVWALIFGDLKVRQDQKIVWRLTGAGDPQFTVTGPHGERARVVFGPEEHGSSNWHHNGDEWGTGFNFPVAGCWNLHVTRGKAAGDVWLTIK